MAEISGFPRVPQAKVFLGAAYTGKTQSLLAEIDSLLRGKADAREVIVFCATPAAAQDFSARLQAVCPKAKGLAATTPRAFFLKLLDTEAACAATGRKPRLLQPFEYGFFLEDLKTSGIRPQRLREILKFFYKGLSELADASPGWLVTNEERELYSMIKSWLSFTGAILPPELAGLAVNYLMGSDSALEDAGKGYVFVDDFQLLSRASQLAVCLLTKECICLSADPAAAIEAYESYPYPNGVEELLVANQNADVVRLNTCYSCYPAAKASQALRQEGGFDAASLAPGKDEGLPGLRLIEGDGPQDEINRVVDAVEQLLDSGVCANDIVLAAPHPVWMQNLLRQLRSRAVAAEMLLDAGFLNGDIRSNEKCLNARLVTALNLIADPTDAVAWRCCCGFDDHLANSDGMRFLRGLGQAQGKTLDIVIRTSNLQQDIPGGADAAASIQRIAKAKDEAQALIDKLGSLRGQQLLEAIARQLSGPEATVPEEVKSLVLGSGPDDGRGSGPDDGRGSGPDDGPEDGRGSGPDGDSALSMSRRARSRMECPAYGCASAVRVASYRGLVGISPKHLFLTGLMNGFFPKHDYFDGTVLTIEQMEKRHAEDLAAMACVVAKAGQALTVSYCKKLDLEAAERLRLVINRIFLDNGRRFARTEPSIFLEFINT